MAELLELTELAELLELAELAYWPSEQFFSILAMFFYCGFLWLKGGLSNYDGGEEKRGEGKYFPNVLMVRIDK